MKKTRNYKKQSLLKLLLVFVVVILVNVLFSRTYMRFDLTEEKRYTISSPTKQMLDDINDIVYVQIFLAGDLPADYQKLQNELQDILDEYRAYADVEFEYDYIDPFDHPSQEDANEYIRSLIELGLETRRLSAQSLEGKVEKYILPGMLIGYKGKEVAVNLLPEQRQQGTGDPIASAVSTLEYKISNSLRKLMSPIKQKIAFLNGHGELPIRNLGDIATTLQQQQFELDFLNLSEVHVISQQNDLAIIAKPTKRFSEEDKFKIDQYIMHGGKVLWVMDALATDLDSLRGPGTEGYITQDYDLNLDDILFNYGVRLNLDLVQDIQSAQIPLGSQQQFYPWPYFPVIYPEIDHPVTKHLDPLITFFPGSLDTISTPGIKKEILIQSSRNSRALYHPVSISLREAVEPMLPEKFNKSHIPIAVALEGNFNSIFRTRLSKKFLSTYQDSLNLEYRQVSEPTKMIVISDGDMIKNELGQGNFTYPLGFYKYAPNHLYANRDFIMNCIDYLTDDYGLVATRSKEFKTRPLDREKVSEEAITWQLLNLALPVAFVLLFAGSYSFYRKRKYA